MNLEPHRNQDTNKKLYKLVPDKVTPDKVTPDKAVSPQNLAYSLWRDRHESAQRVFFAEKGKFYSSWSCQQIWIRACRWAQFLEEHTAPEDRIIISLPNNHFFVEVFFACIISKRIPVPLTHHLLSSKNVFNNLLSNVHKTVNAALIISDLPKNSYQKIPLIHVRKQKLPAFIEKTWEGLSASPEDLSLIQFSSGSTSSPKGVMLTHRAITQNIHQILNGLSAKKEDRLCSWLPFYHDMGLVGGLLAPLYGGQFMICATPEEFLRSPKDWIQLVSREQGTIIMGPDFYYRQLVKKVPKALVANLDLSSLRLALSGSEPVSVKNCRDFLRHFSPAQINKNVMFPVYGLAENSLAVTFPDTDKKFKTSFISNGEFKPTEVISCGKPLHGIELRIVDENGEPQLERQVGDIQIKSPSMTHGYYGNNKETQKLFDNGWLITGDIGFMEDGELFVIGRKKDQIVLNGKNFDPSDFECHLVNLDNSHLGRIVVVSSSKETTSDKKIIVVAETKILNPIRRYQMKKRIRMTLYKEKSIIVDVCFVPPGTLPRTSSGKVKRYQVKQNVTNGLYSRLEQVFIPTYLLKFFTTIPKIWNFWISQKNKSYKDNFLESALTKYFRQELSEILKIPEKRININRVFVDYNLDSVDIVGLNVRLKENIIDLSLAQFIQFSSTKELIHYLLEEHTDAVRTWYEKRV